MHTLFLILCIIQRMNSKQLAGAIILAVVLTVGGFYLYKTYQRQAIVKFLQTPVLEMKKNCRVTTDSPFVDKEFKLAFDFGPNLLVCDLASDAGTRRIYIWKKEAFDTSSSATFFPGIFGEISVNLPLDAPNTPHIDTGAVTKEETSRIAGATTTIQETQTERLATLKHDGNTFVLAESSPSIGLLASFRFTTE
jgi:hypothetical protein